MNIAHSRIKLEIRQGQYGFVKDTGRKKAIFIGRKSNKNAEGRDPVFYRFHKQFEF